jgi:NAD(P)H-hydrate epimerase
VGADSRGATAREATSREANSLDIATLDDAVAAELLPERPARAHKGTFGRLLVVAGSLDYAGAALLAASAATRAGAGLVVLAIPASLQPLFAGRVLEVTTLRLPEQAPGVADPDGAIEASAQRAHDALVVGPGLTVGAATDELVVRLMAGEGDSAPGGAADRDALAPAVIDAEALNGLARRPGWWRDARRPAVLTPHPGEFLRLSDADPALAEMRPATGDPERAAAATGAARSWNQVVVLKGARTVIAAPDGAIAVAPFEDPALATAGSGDVLAGTIGALLAQGRSPWDAARLGVYLHGMAGEAVREALGDSGAVASDLLIQLPLARRRLVAARDRAPRPLGFSTNRGERT